MARTQTLTQTQTHTLNVTDFLAIPLRQSRSNKRGSFMEKDTLNILEETSNKMQRDTTVKSAN